MLIRLAGEADDEGRADGHTGDGGADFGQQLFDVGPAVRRFMARRISSWACWRGRSTVLQIFGSLAISWMSSSVR